MASFCIPKHLVSNLKKSALRGEVDIARLHDLSSKERNQFFTKFTDPEVGTFLNVEFEKAMISKDTNAFLDWAESAFDPKVKKTPVYKNVTDKINALKDLGVLTPESKKAFLEDLVSDKLGIRVSPEEVAQISTKAERISKAQKAVGDNLGSINDQSGTMEFFKAKKEMDEYLESVSPASQLKVSTGTIGRGMMLASAKSPLLNIGSNIELAFTEALSRRIASGQLRGANNKAAIEYVKMVNKVYQETGYDISRMLNVSDSGTSGQRVLGDTVHSGGPGMVRKVGRVVEDVVFKQLMGAPDVAFSAGHFADSVNLNSMKMAKGDKTLASSMMEDAMRIQPKTEAGEILRSQGILDAQTATWTNSTWASKTSEGIRKIFNDVSGDARVGDYLLPFIRTSANFVATGMDYAGLGAFKSIGKAVKVFKSKGEFDPQTLQSITRDLVRSGLGLTGATVIASMLDDDDFMGAYDPGRAQIEKLRNSNWNAFRVGGKWFSTAWLAPLAVPVTAMMYARKYGKTKPEMIYQYGRGVANQVLDIPGLSDARDYFKSVAYKKNKTLEEATGETGDYISGEIASRLIPSISADLAKALDPYERETKGHPIKAKIPFVRETLPIKTNVFGEKMEGDSAAVDILFGSRVRTDKDNEVLKTLREVGEAVDKNINFTDWDKSSSKNIELFKNRVSPEKFEKAKNQYGELLKNELNSYLKSSAFNASSDEDRYNKIIGLDSKIMKRVFLQNGFFMKFEKSLAKQEKSPFKESGE